MMGKLRASMLEIILSSGDRRRIGRLIEVLNAFELRVDDYVTPRRR